MLDDESSAAERVIIGCCNLISDRDGRYVLVKEAKPSARGRFNLPAGKPEVGETLVEAAIREAFEETGLVVQVEHLVGLYQCPKTSEGFGVVNFVFSSLVVGGSLTETREHPVVQFFAWDEIRSMAQEGLIRGSHIEIAIGHHQLGRSLPLDLLQIVLPSPMPSASEAGSSPEAHRDVATNPPRICSFCHQPSPAGTVGDDGHLFICDECERDAEDIRDLQANIGQPDKHDDGSPAQRLNPALAKRR